MKRQDSAQLAFFLDGYPVGIFKENGYPTSPGRYRYCPYRGAGHLRMGTALREGLQPRCTFRTEERSVSFRVVNVPKYGLLDLTDFQEEPN
jgi:hypothetical protein